MTVKRKWFQWSALLLLLGIAACGVREVEQAPVGARVRFEAVCGGRDPRLPPDLQPTVQLFEIIRTRGGQQDAGDKQLGSPGKLG